MRYIQYTVAVFALVALSGWLFLRKPYSPTQELPPVAYTAFEVAPPTEHAGQLLAQAARGWKGVTASTYNPSSGLLVLSYTEETSERALQSRVQMLSAKTVSKKIFPEPAGPKCPVPLAALAALPNWFLGVGLVLSLAFALMVILQKKPVLSPQRTHAS